MNGELGINSTVYGLDLVEYGLEDLLPSDNPDVTRIVLFGSIIN